MKKNKKNVRNGTEYRKRRALERAGKGVESFRVEQATGIEQVHEIHVHRVIFFGEETHSNLFYNSYMHITTFSRYLNTPCCNYILHFFGHSHFYRHPPPTVPTTIRPSPSPLVPSQTSNYPHRPFGRPWNTFPDSTASVVQSYFIRLDL